MQPKPQPENALLSPSEIKNEQCLKLMVIGMGDGIMEIPLEQLRAKAQQHRAEALADEEIDRLQERSNEPVPSIERDYCAIEEASKYETLVFLFEQRALYFNKLY